MLVLLLPLLSGCILWDEEGTAVPLPDDRPDLEAYTVVAPIDTGINVYHNHFIMNESFPSSLLEGLNVTMICDIKPKEQQEDMTPTRKILAGPDHHL